MDSYGFTDNHYTISLTLFALDQMALERILILIKIQQNIN